MKTQHLITTLFLMFNCTIYAQRVQQISSKDLPPDINTIGKIKNVFQWHTDDTLNYLIFSEKEVYKTYPDVKETYLPEYEMTSNEFYFYHYKANQLQWRIYDYVKECRFDIHFKFVADAFTVTDLDNNGQQEIWIMYALSCTSDVSPDNLKLIMYEGKKKYAIRGVTRDYETTPVKEMDSEKEINANFINGNPAFKQFALKLWKQNNLYPK